MTLRAPNLMALVAAISLSACGASEEASESAVVDGPEITAEDVENGWVETYEIGPEEAEFRAAVVPACVESSMAEGLDSETSQAMCECTTSKSIERFGLSTEVPAEHQREVALLCAEELGLRPAG